MTKIPELSTLRECVACARNSDEARAEMYRLIECVRERITAMQAEHAAELDRRERKYAEAFNELMKNKSH
jgi:hypothetical protein